MGKIPWEIIGPAGALVIIILGLVFGFMLKIKKLERPSQGPSSNLNTLSKKSLCFKHEGDIASNKTAIGMIGDGLERANKENSDAHGKIFDKLEDLGKEIIREVKKVNKA